MTANVEVWKPVPHWPRRIVRLGLVFAGIVLVLMIMGEDSTPEDRTVALSVAGSGLYTLALARTRARWLPRPGRHPLRRAVILGSANAAVIETLFLAVEKLLGAEGVAAHPNLLLDLLFTMPWYIGMVAIFARVQHRRRFSPSMVLLLGGLYEIGGDGFVGGLLSGELLTPAAPLLLFGVMWWLFIPVYSSMVLVPAWLIEQVPPPPVPESPAWRDALRPLVWLIPFTLYVLVVMIAVSG